jgi:tripartite ATP-independent transporter DctM subunit
MDVAQLVRLERAAVALTRRVSFIGVVGMLIIGILTSVDVIVLRTVFNAPVPGSNELLSTIFAVAIAAVLPGGLAQRANIEIDFLSKRLGPRAALWLRAVGGALFLLVLALIAWRVIVYAQQAQQRGQMTQVLQLPMAPFIWMIAGLVTACVPVQLVVVACRVTEALGLKPSGDAKAAEGEGARIAVWVGAVLIATAAVAVLAYYGGTALHPLVRGQGIALAAIFFILVWILVLSLMPLAAALAACGLLGAALLLGFPSAFSVLGSETVGLITNADLAVLPLFLMMAGFATAAGLSTDIYRLAHVVFAPLRGGLALATIGGCAGFGALTGSSIATVVTIGSVALPEMKRRGYSVSLSTGCVVAGGTLGQLVPPSTAIVLYALITELSIGRLYIAVLIPAALTVLLYLAAIMTSVAMDPGSAPGRDRFDWREFLAALKACTGVFIMFVAVIGGIYSGVFTVTEAASVGAVIAFAMALLRGKLRRGALWEVVGDTTRSTSMLYLVIIGALVLSFLMGTSGLPSFLTEFLSGSGLTPIGVVLCLVAWYLVLGMVMDAFTIMILTAPLAAAIVADLGYDPIWWAILTIVLIEMGLTTPPFGMNLFAIKSLTPEAPFATVARGVLPFIAADVVKLALLIAFPALILWLPTLASGR